MSDLGKLYQQALLEHDKTPRRTGQLEAPTHSADGNNPLCGDRVKLTLRVEGTSVADVRCDVRGCAICRASGSMLTDAIIGRELSEVKLLAARFLSALAEPAPPATPAAAVDATAAPATEAAAGVEATRAAEWGPLAALLEARRFPNRRRCATLSWEALERALPVER